VKSHQKRSELLWNLGYILYGAPNMITLSDDEVALLKSLLTALRSIKVRDIDKALVILSKANRNRSTPDADFE
jgi:hypothetical protein